MKIHINICEASLQSIRPPRPWMIGKSNAAAAKLRKPSNRMAGLEKPKPIDVCVEVRMRRCSASARKNLVIGLDQHSNMFRNMNAARIA
jgi:hypothetical protein